MTSQRSIAVIGAGIAGLCTAYWLEQQGYEVQVFEKGRQPGGVIQTERAEGFLVDTGPNSTLETSPILRDLVEELGLAGERVYASTESNKRYILKNGNLEAVPTSLTGFLRTPLFSWKAKLRLLREPFISPTPGEDVALADFVRHRLGQEFLDYAINPFVAGVYAGDPKSLSTAAGFPKLYALEKNYGSLIKGALQGARERKKRKEVAKDRAKMFSFKQGMQTLTDALAKHLRTPVQTHTTVTALQKKEAGFLLTVEQGEASQTHQFGQVVLTAPTHAMGPLLQDIAPATATALSEVYYPPVSVVYTGFRLGQVPRPLDGFGYLIPEKEKREILGTIWSSTIFPGRAPEGMAAFTSFVGGTRQPENALMEEEKLVQLVVQELQSIMGIEGSPAFSRVKRWEKAIPQYRMGYQQIQQAFDGLEQEHPGLFFAGNFRRGISVGDSVLSAHETVERMVG